jgi:hypothetical protein
MSRTTMDDEFTHGKGVTFVTREMASFLLTDLMVVRVSMRRWV